MNTKMKVLSLALVGAFGYVGVASAACPSSPVPPWSSVQNSQGVTAIATPGYAGTECRLDASINAGAGLLAAASVRYSQATTEPRYRVHFIINADSLTSLGSSHKVRVFGSSSTAGGTSVNMTIFGFAGNKVINYSVRNADGTVTGGQATLAAGDNHIEFDLQTASAASATDGYFKLWVNNNTEGSPTANKPGLANFGVGADRFTLGLSSPSREFVTNQNGKAVGFDQFDSRRQTFIGF